MKGIRTTTEIVTELAQYFLQKTILLMLINHPLNKKHSKYSISKYVNNPAVHSFEGVGVGLYCIVYLTYIIRKKIQ